MNNIKPNRYFITILLIIVLNTVLIINIFQDSNSKKEIKIFLFFLFVLSCLNYVGGTKNTQIYGGFEDSKISREELKDF